MQYSLDINCDLGEFYGNFNRNFTEEILSNVSSCNIACGSHSGDPVTILETIKIAHLKKIAIGAHPSFPDLQGFGRRVIDMSENELTSNILYQCSAIKGMCEAVGAQMTHVKPHGALYNLAAKDRKTADIVVKSIKKMGARIALMGLAYSEMDHSAQKWGVKFISEGFADRRYQIKNELMSRKLPNAVIYDPQIIVQNLDKLIKENKIETQQLGSEYIEIDSLCVHGDSYGSVEILKEINRYLSENKITLKAKYA